MNARRAGSAAPQRIAFAVMAALAGGCTFGPNYQGPPEAAPRAASAPGFHRAPIAPVSAAPPLAEWWTALNDATLNRLEAQALQASPTLGEALARVRNARATLRERETALLPTGGANAAALRARIPLGSANSLLGTGAGASSSGTAEDQAPPPKAVTTNLFTLAGDAIWQIDLFGGTRRQIESAEASAAAQQANLEDAQVTLTGDVAKAFIDLRDAQNRLQLSLANTAVQERVLALTQQRRLGGTASDGDVERALSQLKQTRAEEVPLLGQVEIHADQLAQLVGQEPGSLDGELRESPGVPLPPAETAVGDPAALIRRRPDVRAAERQIAAANASIGASIAQYFPTVRLIGTIGFSSPKTPHLLTHQNLNFVAGPALSWNVFDFPQIGAQVEASRADLDQSTAAYRSAVLSALRDAENALSRFGYQRRNVGSLAEASASAQRSARIAQTRFSAGTISLIDALDVERQRLQTESSLAQAQAQLTNDWISLQGALGLGWAGAAGGVAAATPPNAPESAPR